MPEEPKTEVYEMGATTAATGPITTAVIEDGRGFAALRGEWDGLYGAAPMATPFQSWAWLYSWWEAYGEGERGLRLVAVRDRGGLLVGLLPMMLEGRPAFGRLSFVGAGRTNYLDVLAREGWEGPVAEAGAEALRRVGGWRVADLQQLRPGAAAWELYRLWGGPKAWVLEAACPAIDVESWEALLSSRSKSLRSTTRRSIRRAEADGVSRTLASAGEAREAARRLVALHRESWEGRDIATEHLGRRFEEHLVAAAKRMTEGGTGAVSEFWRDGEAIASQFLVFGHDAAGFLTFGATREALERYQVSSLLIWDGVEAALDRGVALFDLMQGEEPYKLRWSTCTVPVHRAILGRSPVAWAPYAARRVLQPKAKRYAKRRLESENAPPWARRLAGAAAARYRALRRTTTRA